MKYKVSTIKEWYNDIKEKYEKRMKSGISRIILLQRLELEIRETKTTKAEMINKGFIKSRIKDVDNLIKALIKYRKYLLNNRED